MSEISYAALVQRDFRLCLLKTLAEQPSYTGSETILQAIAKSYGHARSRESVRTELNFLASVSAVTLKEQGGYSIASITRRGLDHVEGLVEIDGVNRPSPKE